MANWWVNHKQTLRQEIDGGYLWSPKTKRNGASNRFYDNMREARPGDPVVSFANAHITYHGTVSGFPSSEVKPNEFGASGDAWADDGWLVPVAWTELPKPIRPKDHMDDLRPLLPETHSPIRPTGDGNQGAYLARIGEPLLRELERLGGFEADGVIIANDEDRPFHEAAERAIEERLQNDQTLDKTETEAVIRARKGQGTFRRNVQFCEPRCRVTGLDDLRLLVASHIKPWRACTTAAERLDGANGLLLAPHIDRLFDIGLITFAADGAMQVSASLDEPARRCLGLADAMATGVGAFTERQETYLAHHREHVFLS